MRKPRRRTEWRPLRPGELKCRFTAFFDGCCEPVNPGGTAGFGAAIYDRDAPNEDGMTLHPKYGVRVLAHSGMIPAAPTTSNNVAEYLAVNAIFDWLIEREHWNESIQVFGDSKLVVCQLWGEGLKAKWKIHGIDTKDKKPGFYAEQALIARGKLMAFRNCLGFWIPRDENGLADELSKAELKRAGVEFRIQPEEDDDDGRQKTA